MKEQLVRLPNWVIKNSRVRAVAFTTVLALSELALTPTISAQEIIKIEPPVSPLTVENWQKGALRFGLAGLLTGAFALRVGTTLRQNEGSTQTQKRWNKAGLITQGASTALLDSVLLTATF